MKLTHGTKKCEVNWIKRFGCEMQEMRSEKSEIGNEDFECSHPISHFSHNILRPNNWILPREMGNEIQTRILATEVLPSEIVVGGSVSCICKNIQYNLERWCCKDRSVDNFNLTHRHTISHEFMSQFTKLCTDLEEPVVLVGNSIVLKRGHLFSEERIFSHMCFPSSVILEKKLAGKNRTHFSNTTHDPIVHTKYHYKFPTYFAFYAHAKFSKG